jgi:trk system potassium uptake protein TrkA
MQFIIFGLGNFGLSLALKLTKIGHEVIGVDKSLAKIDLVRDRITHAVSLDSTNIQAVSTLPIRNADAVIIAIGENEGASIMTTALIKQLKPKRIISRSISTLQETVLETMGITEIVHPEEDSAERLALRLDMKGVVESFSISEQYSIVEVKTPLRYIGKTLLDANLRSRYGLNVLTIMRTEEKTNLLGISRKKQTVIGALQPDTKLLQDDILVIFGNKDAIQKFMD